MNNILTNEKTEKTSELIQLVESSGLEKAKQNQIAETLGVFFNKASEWDATIQSIVITSPEETGKMRMAREGRLTLKNMRLEAEKIVKAKREEVKHRMANDLLEDKLWLKAWQMIEATFKNLEMKLEEKEKFAERWEAEQREKLRKERLSQLLPLGFQFETGIDLGNMDEQTFQNLKLGLETAKREREEAERRAEEERLKAERVSKLHNERKNSILDLWKYATEFEKGLNFGEQSEKDFNSFVIRLKNSKKEEEELAKKREAEMQRLKQEADAEMKRLKQEADAEMKRLKQEADAERKALEEKARKEKAAADAKLKAEREAKEKLEAELRAKKEAEARAAAELKAKQEAEAKAAKAPKKKRLKMWIDGLILTPPAGMNEDVTVIEILEKFEAFKRWAKTKIDAL
jgi:hypothetical protein